MLHTAFLEMLHHLSICWSYMYLLQTNLAAITVKNTAMRNSNRTQSEPIIYDAERCSSLLDCTGHCQRSCNRTDTATGTCHMNGQNCTDVCIDNNQYIALDCEFVGVGPNKLSALGMSASNCFWFLLFLDSNLGWWRGTMVERRSSAAELFLSHARPSADSWPLMWVSRPLEISQLGLLSLSFDRVDKWVVSCN